MNTCRNNGMGLAPIPWDKIRDYAEIAQLDEELVEPFIRIIRAMDTAFMTWQDNQASNSSDLGNKTKARSD